MTGTRGAKLMNIGVLCNSGSGASAIVAAILWLLSASKRAPRYVQKLDAESWDGSRAKTEDDLDRLTTALYYQSRYSAFAALFACVAAVLQTISAFFGLVESLG